MTQEQETHLEYIKQKTLQLLDAKYRKGQAEHGGNLWDIDLLDNAIDEAIDMITYLLALKEKLSNRPTRGLAQVTHWDPSQAIGASR